MNNFRPHLWALALILVSASCATQRQAASAFNPYRDGGTPPPSSVAPGAEDPGKPGTAADILRNTEVGDDFYRTEDEMWKEHEANLRRVERKYRWIAWLKKKPQYSNPEYYGHRRKPKIRPVGKRRLCKECGIVH